jgi:site-specific DNA-cytosine methylase
MSCDLLPSEKPGNHHLGDVREILYDGWDLMVAHPPCQYLTSAGARWWGDTKYEQETALAFVVELMHAPIPRIALENPVGIISSRIRKPDQIINPYEFGHVEMKRTCLWLKDLPLLYCTSVVTGRDNRLQNLARSNNRWRERSRTFLGIAEAMADQWGE